MYQHYCHECKQPLPLSNELPADVVGVAPVGAEGYFIHKSCLPEDNLIKNL